MPVPRRSSSSTSPSTGRAPSATTTMLKCLPAASRSRILSQTFSMSNGISGIRITSAVPLIPLCSAIQPASRPISSTTITRWWLSAVEWSLSMASVAMLTAVSKPNVCSVAATSLSMVLGTHTTGRPFAARPAAICRLPSPPMATSASKPLAWKAAISSSERSTSWVVPSAAVATLRKGLPRLVVPRMVPPWLVMPRTSSGSRCTTPWKLSSPS